MKKGGLNWAGGVVGSICDASGNAITVAGLTVLRTGGKDNSSYGVFKITAASGVTAGTYHVKFRDGKDAENYVVVDIIVK